MSHNTALPRHRYVWVMAEFVLRPSALAERSSPLIPAVWYGVSVQPGRVMGCHVVLENGAMIVDLPLHALRSMAQPEDIHWSVQDACRWDGFGWSGEAWEPPYVSGLTVRVLDAQHRLTDTRGTLWFCMDHLDDGYSLEPGQHKHLWVVALESGHFTQVPQDMLLIHEASFTDAAPTVPKIARQQTLWQTES